MAKQTYWESLGLPEHGNAFTGTVPKGGAASTTLEQDKELARLERKRAYEREYKKHRYDLMKAATRVNPIRCI